MLIAVTGASGFVGGRVADSLASYGHDVIGFGRRPLHGVAGRGWRGYVSWDVTRGAIVAPYTPDAVVHCAGTVSDWGPSQLFDLVNVGGTRAVLATFSSSGRFIHLSTASVYDPRRPKRWVTESAPLPRRYLNAYSSSKRRAEEVVRDARPDAIVLRPHAVYGPGDRVLLPRLIAARRGGRLLACGNGRNRLSVTHIDNLVLAVALAVEADAVGLFNIADAQTPTLRELLEAVDRAIAGRGVVLIPQPIAACAALALEGLARLCRRTDAPLLTRYIVAQLAADYTLDISRARRLLGYKPMRAYSEAIPEAVDDVMKQCESDPAAMHPMPTPAAGQSSCARDGHGRR